MKSQGYHPFISEGVEFMKSSQEQPRQIVTDLFGRLDRLAWGKVHTVVLIALGIGWALDGFEVTIVGPMLSFLAKYFHMTVQQAADVGSVFLLGAFAGALIFSVLADRLGRKRLFLVTILLYGLATLATAFSTGYISLLIFRFLTGFGIGGEYGAVNAAIDEFIPARYRGRADGAVNASWSIGSIVASLTSLVVLVSLPPAVGWRYAFLFGGVVAIFVAIVRRILPESPRWLAYHGHLDQAETVVEKVEASCLQSSSPLHSSVLEIGERSWWADVRQLWRRHPGRVLLAMSLNIGEAAPYYGLLMVLGLIILPANGIHGAGIPYFYLYGAVLGLVGAFGVAWAADKWGRKPSVTTGFIALVLMSLSFMWIHGSVVWLLVVFGVYSVVGQVAGTGTYIVTSELFPTEHRALGIGLAVATGRVAALGAPLVFAALNSAFGVQAVYWGMAGFAAFGATGMGIWSLVGKEGRGVSLEDMVARPAFRRPQSEVVE